jgi:peptidoglycan-associated lipoprotein
MIRRALIFLGVAAAAAAPSASWAQLRVPAIVQRVIPATRGNQPPQLVGIDALRADFRLRSGSDTIYFGGDSALLSAPARATLAAQAQWLRQFPGLVVQIEGHADTADTRDHALAVGIRRAEAVRQYLILLGVPAAQISAVTYGKERAAGAVNARAVTVLVR